MNLFRLIRGIAWHIFGCRRLLVWHLLFCFIYASCSTQMQYGIIKDRPMQSEASDLARSNLTYSKESADCFAVLQYYCQADLDATIQDKLEKEINILCDEYFIKYSSNKTPDGDNLLHYLLKLLINKSLSEPKKNFLEKVAINLIDRSVGATNLLNNKNSLCVAFQKCDPKMINKIGNHLDLINQLNNKNETPFHIAAEGDNTRLFELLFNRTDFTKKDIHDNNRIEFILNNPKTLQGFLKKVNKLELSEFLIEKVFFEVKNKQGENAFSTLFKKVTKLESNDPQLDLQLDFLLLLDKYHDEYHIKLYKEHYNQIGKVPEIPYKVIKNPLKINQEQECCICFEPIGDKFVQIKFCKHLLHILCYLKLCKASHERQRRTSCPLCREDIYKDYYGEEVKVSH